MRVERTLVPDASGQNPVLLLVVGITDLPERAEGRERGVGGVEEEIEGLKQYSPFRKENE